MSFALAILTLGAWVLMAQKMPTWNWFMTVKGHFPKPLAALWDAWAGCVFCGGFWIALLLKLATGLATVPELNHLHPLLAYSLDALATTTLASITMSLTGPMTLLLTAARAKQEAENRRAANQQSAAAPATAAATAAS
ncbi:MAG: hypothetical protein AB7U82_01945 [Blastocatellales bacterium]